MCVETDRYAHYKTFKALYIGNPTAKHCNVYESVAVYNQIKMFPVSVDRYGVVLVKLSLLFRNIFRRNAYHYFFEILQGKYFIYKFSLPG